MNRKYPLAKPPGHKPPMKRWKLDFSTPTTIHTTYIGIQRHDSTSGTLESYKKAMKTIQSELEDTAAERFSFLEGDDAPSSTIWVSYRNSTPSATSHDAGQINLQSIYTSLPAPKSIGLWKESFTAPTSRLETNYSGLDYLPGLARLPETNSTIKGHELTAYWGAARDRIPDSGTDLFASETGHEDAELKLEQVQNQETCGKRLYGTNTANNIVHIRSGQFWENCSEEESQAYEENLQPALMQGLRYVWENRSESGALGMRFLQEKGGTGAKETCASGFFRNLSDLEKWAKGHPSHHRIFNGAIQHARRFGESRKFRTWHEVSVLKRGEAKFEYLNCVQRTGITGFLELRGEDL
ncbi:hem-containing dehydratase protein [Aspergillus venezuelensis]